MAYMDIDASYVEDEINLQLANAKRAQREVRSVVQGLARLRDHLQIVQSEEDTTYDQHSSNNRPS